MSLISSSDNLRALDALVKANVSADVKKAIFDNHVNRQVHDSSDSAQTDQSQDTDSNKNRWHELFYIINQQLTTTIS